MNLNGLSSSYVAQEIVQKKLVQLAIVFYFSCPAAFF